MHLGRISHLQAPAGDGAHERHTLTRWTVAVIVAAGVALAPVPASAAERRQDTLCVDIENTGTEDTYLTDDPSVPLKELGVAELHERLGGEGRAGAGVRVAVVDSGIADGPLLDVMPGTSYANKAELMDYHGTAVAGLVAGRSRDGEPTGVAPGAQVVDVRVYDDDVPDEGAVAVEPGRVIQGLQWVADNAGRLGIGVVVVPIRVGRSGALAEVVRRLHREEDVVVVAASGNRPTEETDPLLAEYGELRPGEDVARVIYPAGYERDVVAVNATVGGHPEEGAGLDPREFVLQNSATDVASPTYDAVTLGLNGSTCLLRDVATSWSAAIVAGLVAVLRAAYPREDADQIVARLRQTASGSPDDVHVLLGAGVVQPLDALSRRLTPDAAGDLDELPPADSAIPPAKAPTPEPDALAPARDDAVWWGLLGGAAVVLALLLRPLLARRR